MKDLTKQLKSLYKIQPSPEWKVLARKEILATIESENSPYKANRWAEFLYYFKFSTGFFNNFMAKPIGTFILALLLVLGGGILKVKADSSLPGDLLYALKRGGEKARMVFVFNKNEKSDLQLALVDERVKELNMILSKDDIRDKEIKQAFDNFHKDFIPVKENLSLANNSEIAKKVEDKTNDFKFILSKTQKNVPENSKKDVKNVIAEINKVNLKALQVMAVGNNNQDNKEIAVKINDKIGELSKKAKNSVISKKALAKLDKAKQDLSNCNFVMALQMIKESTEILDKKEETTNNNSVKETTDMNEASTTIDTTNTASTTMDILKGDNIENATSSDKNIDLQIDKKGEATTSTDNILEKE